jgi:hypothetical protein
LGGFAARKKRDGGKGCILKKFASQISLKYIARLQKVLFAAAGG